LTLLKARAYSSGHCPGFTHGSLLCPDIRKEITDSITASNILSNCSSLLMMKKKYSHHYERYFYKFIASNECWIYSKEKKDYLQMKRIIRLFVILLVISSLTGIVSSCKVFNETSHAENPKSFKHKQPLPKKWVINNGDKPIAK
jgi:hypothetical protein